MDQLGSHISPSEVGSGGHSEMQSEARAAVELAALEHVVFDETASERNDRQAAEAAGIGTPDTIQDEDEDDDEYSDGNSNGDDGEESETSQAAK